MSGDGPLPQILAEARRLATAALEQDVPIRLVGGLAVRIRVDEAFHPGLSREYKDIDFVTLKGRNKQVATFIEGYDIAQSERAVVEERLDRLWERIEAEPKSRRWRLRDRVGDRRRWYDEPEEVDA